MTTEELQDRYSLLSPEGVNLDFPLSGPGPRMLALLVDQAILAVVSLTGIILLFVLLPSVGLDLNNRLQEWVDSDFSEALSLGASGIAIGFWWVGDFLIRTLYHVAWEVLGSGSTAGKRALGLRVVQRGGHPIDLKRSLIRNFMRWIDFLPSFYTVGLLSVVLSKDSQRLGDWAAGTLVIRLDRPKIDADFSLPETLEALPLTREQLEALGEAELELLRRTLRRVGSRTALEAENLARIVLDSLAAKLQLEFDAHAEPLRLLERLFLAAEQARRRR